MPNFLPPEWNSISKYQLREPNYWLGKGIVVWFEQTKDQRLRSIAELGPITYTNRLAFLEKLEQVGIPVKENSKLEKARYTRFFTQKVDINKWDDMDELTQAMFDLYNSPEFTLLRNQVANILEGKISVPEIKKETSVTQDSSVNYKDYIQKAFRKWVELKAIPNTHYRVTARNLSFKIPLFDQYKERLGETREKWWWDNGPFLFWINYNEAEMYFVLEVGPIEADKRVQLMESLQEQGITFNKKGLTLDAKYTRIFSKTVANDGYYEEQLIDVFDTIYNDNRLQEILDKLRLMLDEF
ncbi:hypothetical protein [Pallidibacillus pasinlerensis]|uniref:Uncharacterized protein n=1 Tax=Pallidibacillus pasinlerensis TaxID=2703818 RepID=A0ABX0A5S3_9BACI|nr:hypothetical protein [Pallidibacillus pasinlerensis]NCU18799.1 hypothetical protein [Pallidibacillus pasinlerensis]